MRFGWIAFAAMASLVFSASADAKRYRSVQRSQACASVCVNGSCTTTSTKTVTKINGIGGLQAWAEEEARLMSERGICGHVRPAPAGTFVGVGCGSTCQGSGVLAAEATVNGKTVKVWIR